MIDQPEQIMDPMLDQVVIEEPLNPRDGACCDRAKPHQDLIVPITSCVAVSEMERYISWLAFNRRG